MKLRGDRHRRLSTDRVSLVAFMPRTPHAAVERKMGTVPK